MHKFYPHSGEEAFDSPPPSQPPPPPPPPARACITEHAKSSVSGSRPNSGVDLFLPSVDHCLEAPLPPTRRAPNDVKINRLSQEYDQLPACSECPQAPARPPKPLPRRTAPEIHHRRPYSADCSPENVDAKIAKLMGEGFSFEEVKRALEIAQNNIDVARSILREFACCPPPVCPRLNL
ncbi:unnamed protein product [Staurois parvus]|uniref:UBA domain-containing protein n=1 Tax=Staurois parvus TaxID=386267 RepID=A0ABN9CDB1_9NEOB|nr:unnamed protein product [Staurois parvus]